MCSTLPSASRPKGLAIDLFKIEGETRKHLKTVTTYSDGRVDGGRS